MVKRITILILLCGTCQFACLWGQSLAVKTDVLSDAAASPNISLEQSLGGRFSMDVSLHYNPLGSKGSMHRWKHWLLQTDDRTYMDTVQLYRIHKADRYSVVREKRKMKHHVGRSWTKRPGTRN